MENTLFTNVCLLYLSIYSDSSSLVVVVSSLNALMQDQVVKIKVKVNVMIINENNAKEIDSKCQNVSALPELFASS